MTEWHIITHEYPPQVGGVSDYTYLLASALAAAGDRLHMWCPAGSGDPPPAPGLIVHRELGEFTPGDLHRVGKKLDEFSEKFSGTFEAVAKQYAHSAIMPAETRVRLIQALEMLEKKQEDRPHK